MSKRMQLDTVFLIVGVLLGATGSNMWNLFYIWQTDKANLSAASIASVGSILVIGGFGWVLLRLIKRSNLKV